MAHAFVDMSFGLNIYNALGFKLATKRSRVCTNCQERNVGVDLQNKNNDKYLIENAREGNAIIPDCEAVKKHCVPPLVSALKASTELNDARFHFPGHNTGRAAPLSLVELIGLRPFRHDLPELPELDNPPYDFSWDIAGGTSVAQVDKAMKELEREGRKATVVFVTSPKYHMVFAAIWKRYPCSVMLLVNFTPANEDLVDANAKIKEDLIELIIQI